MTIKIEELSESLGVFTIPWIIQGSTGNHGKMDYISCTITFNLDQSNGIFDKPLAFWGQLEWFLFPFWKRNKLKKYLKYNFGILPRRESNSSTSVCFETKLLRLTKKLLLRKQILPGVTRCQILGPSYHFPLCGTVIHPAVCFLPDRGLSFALFWYFLRSISKMDGTQVKEGEYTTTIYGMVNVFIVIAELVAFWWSWWQFSCCSGTIAIL